jgi:hypothetical protein
MIDLRVLYVGATVSPSDLEVLGELVQQVQGVALDRFTPQFLDQVDLVVVDWPQAGGTASMRNLQSPLGCRESWHHPTLLLGSAGLHVAVTWEVLGGAGCTCLRPLAYGWRDHALFHDVIDPSSSNLRWMLPPNYFKDCPREIPLSFLPLALEMPGERMRRTSKMGWCTEESDLDQHPEVEYLCGGLNHKSARAAALWRQGNLLHFGFDVPLSQLNDPGRRLLRNAMRYIARFTQDRPIARTPSVFAGPIARPRRTVETWLADDRYQEAWAILQFENQIQEILNRMGSRQDRAQWCREHAQYFYPSQDHRLGIDQVLHNLGIPFDCPEFFDAALDHLNSPAAQVVERGHRLLARYAPCGPVETASHQAWSQWYQDNSPYLFATDTGNYRWYIDPLAKTRQIPSRELRGSARAG